MVINLIFVHTIFSSNLLLSYDGVEGSGYGVAYWFCAITALVIGVSYKPFVEGLSKSYPVRRVSGDLDELFLEYIHGSTRAKTYEESMEYRLLLESIGSGTTRRAKSYFKALRLKIKYGTAREELAKKYHKHYSTEFYTMTNFWNLEVGSTMAVDAYTELKAISKELEELHAAKKLLKAELDRNEAMLNALKRTDND